MKEASSKHNLISSDEENENIDGKQVRACSWVSTVNFKESLPWSAFTTCPRNMSGEQSGARILSILNNETKGIQINCLSVWIKKSSKVFKTRNKSNDARRIEVIFNLSWNKILANLSTLTCGVNLILYNVSLQMTEQEAKASWIYRTFRKRTCRWFIPSNKNEYR